MAEKIKLQNKRGQIAIFAIIAVVIVAMILIIFFMMKGNKPGTTLSDQSDPTKYIKDCTKKATEDTVKAMLPQGGFVSPSNYKLWDDKKVSYLCLNMGNYLPCISQHPMFLNEMKQEIKQSIIPQIESCYVSLRSELEKRQNSVEFGPMSVEVSFGPERIFVDVSRNMKITKEDDTRTYNQIKTEIINPIYDLGLVAIEIAANEAKYCYFEYVGYMVLYPRFDIRKTAMSDSTKIYSITHKKSQNTMNIATRGCAIPAGF